MQSSTSAQTHACASAQTHAYASAQTIVCASAQAYVDDVFSIAEIVDKIATYLDNWSITQFASVYGCTNMSMRAAKPAGFTAPNSFAWFIGAVMNDNITAVSAHLARFPEHATHEIATVLVPEVSVWTNIGILSEPLVIGAVRIAAQRDNEDMVLAIAPHYTARCYPGKECMKMIRLIEKYFWPDQKKLAIRQAYASGDFDLLGKLYEVIPQTITSESMRCAMQNEYRNAIYTGNRSKVLCAIEYGWLSKHHAISGTKYLYPDIAAAIVEKYGE